VTVVGRPNKKLKFGIIISCLLSMKIVFADRLPPFLLKEKVASKVQADFDAGIFLK